MGYSREEEKLLFDPGHIDMVLQEMRGSFPEYFSRFKKKSPPDIFSNAVTTHGHSHLVYRNYMAIDVLKRFDSDPDSFKHHTKINCPVIYGCLHSDERAMNKYKASFYSSKGTSLLATVSNLARFGADYVSAFNDTDHENAESYEEMGLSDLEQGEYSYPGVIGYGIQSAMLYGLYPYAFAHRSQNAVWSLYFITNRKDFGLFDGSEFIRIQPGRNTVAQNYFYPPDLFAFYALRLYLLLKQACMDDGIQLNSRKRYIYLSAFTDYIADYHRADINVLAYSSDEPEFDWH